MGFVNANSDPSTRTADEAAVRREPAGDPAEAPSRGNNQWPDVTIEGEDRTPEEAGYGYGV